MNIDNLKRVASQGLGRGSLIARKFSPEILTVAGVVGLVTAGVLAARATLKLEETVDNAAIRVNEAKAKAEVTEDDGTPAHTPGELRKYVAKAQIANAMDLGKLYGPSITLAITSAIFIVGANGIMRKRNVALVAAYKAVEESFSEYRKRVAEELGEDKERDLRIGFRDEEVTDDKGVTKVVTHIDPNGQSQYARIFDESNPNWQRQAEYNLLFVRGIQNMMNDLLIARGHVFLNDVYDALGIPRSRAGAIVGWVISKEGDNYIDFNIYDFSSAAKRAFVNGDERSIWLDFNVDGVIFDKI
jgi:hypothetical protein